MKKRMVVVVAVLSILGMVCLTWALDVRSSNVIWFSRATTVNVTNAIPHPFALKSVVMSFDISQANTFSILLIRGNGIPFTLYTATGTYKSLTWLPENSLVFNLGDAIVFTNSINTPARLIYNYEK